MTTIAVVIPTYNRADLLPLTLAAIRAQTRPPDEIVVVDDASTDDTPSLLARMAAEMGLRGVRTANGGDLVARNVGVRLCASDLVAFCDSDDLWRPDHLGRMAALFDAVPGMLAAYADFRIVRDGVWEQGGKFDRAPAGFWDDCVNLAEGGGVFEAPIVSRLLRFQPFFPSAMMVRRVAFLDAGGWDEAPGRTLGGDFATALRMAESPPVGVLREATVGIRKHRDNRSGDTRRTNLGDAEVLAQALRLRRSLAPYADEIAESIVRRRLDALDDAFASLDFASFAAIRALLPAETLSGSRAIKAAAAALPHPLRGVAARGLIAAASLRRLKG
jgi:glycosyltransferase involved in cell wall biosynthesis